MKTKRPPQAESEWQEKEEFRASSVRVVSLPRPSPRPARAIPAGTVPGSAPGAAAAGRPRGGGARRIRGFTMPASDASLWLDEHAGD